MSAAGLVAAFDGERFLLVARRAFLEHLITCGPAPVEVVRSRIPVPAAARPILGSVPAPLAAQSIIAGWGFVKASCPSRRRSWVRAWQIVEREKALRWLAENQEPESAPAGARQGNLFEVTP